ncbi:MAG: GNAT family N-acetyltransferase [Planctomycetota bacterium]
MNTVPMRAVESREEALALASALDAYAAQAMAEFRDTPLSEGVMRRFFERRFGEAETLLVVAESRPGAADQGVCVTGPFEDPLTGERVPLILLLFVSPDRRHRGVGGALVREVTRRLAARGLARIAGRAAHNDDALISMGERWGFVRQWEWMLRE